MSSKAIQNSIRISIVAAIFAAGYLTGSVGQHNAQADWTDVGATALKEAAGGSGTVSSLIQLGTTITDMEKNVSSLQQNIDTLKKVKSALGGK